MNNFILGINMKPATKIELIAAKRTAPAEQSLEMRANLLNLFSTIKSTKDSIEVFNNSNINTDKIVEQIIKYS